MNKAYVSASCPTAQIILFCIPTPLLARSACFPFNIAVSRMVRLLTYPCLQFLVHVSIHHRSFMGIFISIVVLLLLYCSLLFIYCLRSITYSGYVRLLKLLQLCLLLTVHCKVDQPKYDCIVIN